MRNGSLMLKVLDLGHAVRMAMDLCLYRCLPYLIEKGIRSGEYPVVLVDERPVAMGTGTWFTLTRHTTKAVQVRMRHTFTNTSMTVIK
nr:hypothetical protein L203_06121 [Cryptococcus depauperatus CBS 7841]